MPKPDAKTIETWLADCESAASVPKDRGGPGYSQWELEYIESIREQYDQRKFLSEKQLEKLHDLYERI